ncbi:MAG TPA: DUF3662 and FHA domain-containing protein [Aeromicrobium sp.]|nr:DUF3662 and FHA domain-containing protein [Aeromicrobium sp.]
MAGVLQRFEKRLEGAVTGAFARAFRSAVQPVEIAAALQREIDANASVLSRERTLVPNDFTIELSPADHERLAPYGATLATELSALVNDHITEQRYTAAGPIHIEFALDEELRTGRFTVVSSSNASVTPVRGEPISETAVRRAKVVLDIGGLRHPVNPPGLTIGRGSTADLKIDDPGISRNHAEIVFLGGGVEVRDLGSTNGVIVDGRNVKSATLQDGSQVRLGNTTITVHLSQENA